jgi:RNA polymerase sigma factor (sigma-70 family)
MLMRPGGGGAPPDDPRVEEALKRFIAMKRWLQSFFRYRWASLQQSLSPEDLIQETWIKVQEGLHQRRNDVSFEAWVRRWIAPCVAVDAYRKKVALKRGGGAKLIPLSEIPESSAPAGRVALDPSKLAEQAGFLRDFRDCLDQFPDGNWQPWVLNYLGIADVDAAKALGIPEATLRSRKTSIHAALVKCLEKKGHS